MSAAHVRQDFPAGPGWTPGDAVTVVRIEHEAHDAETVRTQVAALVESWGDSIGYVTVTTAPNVRPDAAPEPGDLTCAECGTTTATTYVVTTLDADDPTTRTEVCRDCDDALRAPQSPHADPTTLSPTA